ncbi:MAG: hypothetical protein ACI9NC_005014 [Verrucomicrobiales bacterium]
MTQVGTHAIGADEFLTITYTRRTDRPDVGWSVEWSQDLAGWDRGAGFTAPIGPPVDNGDGTVSVTERSVVAIDSAGRHYLRAVVETQ